MYRRTIRHRSISPSGLADVKHEESEYKRPRFTHMWADKYICIREDVVDRRSTVRIRLFAVIDDAEGHSYRLPAFHHHHQSSVSPI